MNGKTLQGLFHDHGTAQNYQYHASGKASAVDTQPMNTTPKVLFTKKGFKGLAPIPVSTPEQSAALATWTGAQVIDGDLKEAILELKATGNDKPIVALGGGGFMQNLIATGLIDEYHLAIHPVALGAGLRIFTAPTALKLSDVKAFPKGTVVHVYQPA